MIGGIADESWRERETALCAPGAGLRGERGDVRLAADVVGVEDVEPRHAAVELGYAGEALAAEEGGGLLGV